jgi:hypothetical protein
MRQVKRGAPPVTETKDIFGAETKVLDAEDGIVEAIVSVTGIEDEVADVIEAEAYRKTLERRTPKGIRCHDWDRFAMKTLQVAELLPGDQSLPDKTSRGEPWPRSAGAVKVLMQWNLDTQDGREGFSNVKFLGPEQEWSIGYNVPRGGARMVKGVRHIDTIDLFEYSDVLWGAMPLASGAGVKSYGGIVVGSHDGLWTPPGVKALAGSYEERRDALDEALNRAFRAEYASGDDHEVSGYQMIRATFDDRVVVCFHGRDGDQDWEYEYEMRDGDAMLGERRPVRVNETLVPDTEPEGEVVVEEKLSIDEILEVEDMRAMLS